MTKEAEDSNFATMTFKEISHVYVTVKLRNQSIRELTSQFAKWRRGWSICELTGQSANWRKRKSFRELTTVNLRIDRSICELTSTAVIFVRFSPTRRHYVMSRPTSCP